MPIEMEPDRIELLPREMSRDQIRQRVSAAEENMALRLRMDSEDRLLLAHVLWLQDELERVMEERDAVRDRLQAEITAGRMVLRTLNGSLQQTKRDLDEVQEEGNLHLQTLEKIRTALGIDPTEDLVVAVQRVVRGTRRAAPGSAT